MLNLILLFFFLQNWKEEDFDFPDGYIWDISSNLYTYINIKRYFYQRQLHVFHLVCVCVFFFYQLLIFSERVHSVYNGYISLSVDL